MPVQLNNEATEENTHTYTQSAWLSIILADVSSTIIKLFARLLSPNFAEALERWLF
jgi:hypothetical protein